VEALLAKLGLSRQDPDRTRRLMARRRGVSNLFALKRGAVGLREAIVQEDVSESDKKTTSANVFRKFAHDTPYRVRTGGASDGA